MSIKHTSATDDRIRGGYRDGEPVRFIAKALGVSKNTVIGRARRLGLATTFDRAAARRSQSLALKGKPKPASRDFWASLEPEEKRRRMLPVWAGRQRQLAEKAGAQ